MGRRGHDDVVASLSIDWTHCSVNGCSVLTLNYEMTDNVHRIPTTFLAKIIANLLLLYGKTSKHACVCCNGSF